jgi:hypothetical protein
LAVKTPDFEPIWTQNSLHTLVLDLHFEMKDGDAGLAHQCASTISAKNPLEIAFTTCCKQAAD